MPRFVVGDDRSQSTLFPERLEDYLSEDNPVRAIEVFAMSLIWPGAVQATLDRIPAKMRLRRQIVRAFIRHEKSWIATHFQMKEQRVAQRRL